MPASSRTILGLSCYYHDSAAALIADGRIVAAAQEERFTRKKHDSSFPQQAVNYCLQEAGLAVEEIDYVVFYEKAFRKFDRLLETYLAFSRTDAGKALNAALFDGYEAMYRDISYALGRAVALSAQGNDI